MNQAFIYGVILAFGLILPLGVQNIFIFNQGAIQPKLRYAMPCVLTAFICDTILIIASVAGVSVIVLTIGWLKTLIFITGFIFLLYMGFSTWNSSSQSDTSAIKALSPKRQIVFALSVSILNPHAIIDSVAVIGSNSLNFTGNERISYTIACILVSFFWFIILSLTGHFIHRMDSSGSFIRIINKISALIIWGVACYTGYQLVQDIFN